jgi:hypothetical protein
MTNLSKYLSERRAHLRWLLRVDPDVRQELRQRLLAIPDAPSLRKQTFIDVDANEVGLNDELDYIFARIRSGGWNSRLKMETDLRGLSIDEVLDYFRHLSLYGFPEVQP